MKVIKMKTNCYCANCDIRDAEYIITNNGRFKLYWASEKHDCEIGFCEKCAKELFTQFANVL